MSAGTIIAMAADELLMEPASSLGPIDAQIPVGNKMLSADAIINEIERIKEEAKEGSLNRVYIPILQNISVGEIEAAMNAKEFAIDLVKTG